MNGSRAIFEKKNYRTEKVNKKIFFPILIRQKKML